jgi:hypothetical protein
MVKAKAVNCGGGPAMRYNRNEMPEIALVYAGSGDWVGIYVDGELVDEGHELAPESVLNAVGLDNHDQVGIDFNEAGWKKLPRKFSAVEKVLRRQSPGDIEKL